MSRKNSERSENKGPVRIGFIGCGGIMNSHVDRLKGTPSQIVALMDTVEPAIAMLKSKQPQLAKVPEFSDWEKMLSSAELDAVIIGSPHTVHYEQICAALEKGLHVLCEKPMACTSAHARDLCARAKKSKRVLAISYQRHYQGGYRFLKQAVDSGRIGKVEFVAAYQAQEWLKATRNTWRQKIALSGGGQINDSGSHLMDMLMWTTGLQAEEVSARMEFFGGEVDINSAINVKFTSGAIGTVSIIGNAPAWHEDFTIVGSEGAVYNRNGKIIWQEGYKKPAYEVSRTEDWMDPNKNFVGAILGKCENGCPPEIGLRVIEITEAAWRSHAKNGAPVKVERGSN
ncbi:MAG TPA: Gfo/Idh/MocA family oxidoreductase [Planctomycetota bacterium]|nr:Gfo/Idh/MocA family oxidoreductase [Planctomycetota bacterium]